MNFQAPTSILLGLHESIHFLVEKAHACMETNFVFFTKMLIIIWSKQRNGNNSIQIFENLYYLNKNIVSVYFTREKAEKIGKNEM